MPSKKIGVIGIGRLGLSFALLCERNGYVVYGSDSNTKYLDKLKNKTFKTSEPLVEEYLSTSNNLMIVDSNETVIHNSDIIFTFVPTPSNPDGSYDVTLIDSVVNEILNTNLTNKTFVIGSTVNPEYSSNVNKSLKEQNIKVIYNPEFIRQGNIIEDLINAEFILFGCEQSEDLTNVEDVYNSFVKLPVFKKLSFTAAEITKISINCFLTTKISFANMIGQICINSNLENEVDNVLNTIGSDGRIGNKFLKYGFGFGGPCLPRDNRALGKYAEKIGIDVNLPLSVDEFNDKHLDFIFENYKKLNPHKLPFIFTSLTYKDGVSILESSQPLNLLIRLLSSGYMIIIHENEIKNDIILKVYNSNKDKIRLSKEPETHVGILIDLMK